MRARAPFVVAIALLLAIGIPTSSTLARLTDSAGSSGSFAADTLAPPTGLVATGGATVTLTWSPSADTYATGYAIYRSATSGSGFVLVSTVTPREATTTTDSPGGGTWYYVVRTTAGSWDSVGAEAAYSDSFPATCPPSRPTHRSTSSAAAAKRAGGGWSPSASFRHRRTSSAGLRHSTTSTSLPFPFLPFFPARAYAVMTSLDTADPGTGTSWLASKYPTRKR